MRKSIITVFCIFLVFCLLIGCSGSPETKVPDKEETKTEETDKPKEETDKPKEDTDSDDSGADAFEENTIQSVGSATISGSGKIKITGNFKAGDGILIKPNTQTRALTRSGDGTDAEPSGEPDSSQDGESNTDSDTESSTEYYKTGNGYYLVMAEEDGEVEIEPEKMNLSEGETVTVGKFNNENDFTITVDEFSKNNVRNILEEYYYADFSTEFTGLDKSDVVIRPTNLTGSTKVIIITKNNGVDANVEGSVDYSDETSLGLLFSVSIGTYSTEPPARLHIVNPIDLSVNDTDKKLTDLFSIVRIKADSLVSDKEYCLQITGVDADTIKAIAGNKYFQKTLLRDNQGSDCGLAIPYFSTENGTITYYIGSFTEDRMLDIDFESFYTGLESVNYGISIIEKPENIPSVASFTDITGSATVTLNSLYDSSDILTVPYKASAKSKVKLTPAITNYTSYGYYYYYFETGNGGCESGAGGLGLHAYKDGTNYELNTIAYFVITLTNGGIKAGEAVATFEKKVTEKYKSGYVYTFKEGSSGKYVSSSGAIVDGITMFFEDEGKDFISGSFVCDSTATELAGLSMEDGFYYCNGQPFGYCNTTYNGTGHRVEKHGYKEEDPTVTYFFEIEKFDYTSATEKSITGKMILLKDNKETKSFDNVSFVWTAPEEN